MAADECDIAGGWLVRRPTHSGVRWRSCRGRGGTSRVSSRRACCERGFNAGLNWLHFEPLTPLSPSTSDHL